MKVNIGASFSHLHLISFGVDPEHALREYHELGLRWIRLGCYWSETEREKGVFDFRAVDSLLHLCQESGLHVVMTVGIKAPRWPEYYIPSYILKDLSLKQNDVIGVDTGRITGALFSFLDEAVNTLGRYTCIKYWQVENEPLDPSGPYGLRIADTLLREEIARVRLRDKRPIVVNVWGNELTKRGLYHKAAINADIVGLDIYPKVPSVKMFGHQVYAGPHDSDSKIKDIIVSLKKQKKSVWISELQAEPWGKVESCTDKQIIINTDRVRDWGADGIFFWGFEYWLQRKIKGNTDYWNAARRAIQHLNAS